MAPVTSLLSTLVLFHACLQQVLCQESPCQNYTHNTCTACVGEELHLQCPESHMITGFVQAGFRLPSDTTAVCDHQSQDCVSEPVLLLGTIGICMWKNQSCRFTLQDYDFGRGDVCVLSMSPKYLITFDLKCEPASSLYPVCDPEDQVIGISQEDSYGYILSPGFPQSYTEAAAPTWKEGCTISIATVQGLGIRLRSVYMDIYSAGQRDGCTEDYIQITWKDHENVSHDVLHCGREPLEVNVASSYAVLTFNFGEFDRSNQGFSLHYSAYEVPERSPGTTEEVQTTTKVNTANGNTGTSMSSQSDDPEHLAVVIPLVLSVSLGLLLALTITAVVVLYYRKCSGSFSPTKENPNKFSDQLEGCSQHSGYCGSDHGHV